MTNIIEYIQVAIPCLIALISFLGLVFKSRKVKRLIKTLKNIKELIIVYKEAISDGKLSEKEKDRLIEHIAHLVRIWI